MGFLNPDPAAPPEPTHALRVTQPPLAINAGMELARCIRNRCDLMQLAERTQQQKIRDALNKWTMPRTVGELLKFADHLYAMGYGQGLADGAQEALCPTTPKGSV